MLSATGVWISQKHFRKVARIVKNQLPSLREALAQAIAGGQKVDSKFLQKSYQRKAILDVLAEWSSQLSAEQCKPLLEVFNAIKIDKVIIDGLKSHNPVKVYDALQLFNLSGDVAHWSGVSRIAAQGNTRLASIAILGLLNNGFSDWDAITTWILDKDSWRLSDLHSVFYMLPEEAVSRLWWRLFKAEERTRVQLVDALLEYDPSRVGWLLRSEGTHPEVLAAGLRKVRNPYYKSQVIGLLQHQQDFVRLQASKTLAVLGSSLDIFLLEPLLSDSSPWVRRRAAETIMTLGAHDYDVLQELMERQPLDTQAFLKDAGFSVMMSE
jgi:hypothetical protein